MSKNVLIVDRGRRIILIFCSLVAINAKNRKGSYWDLFFGGFTTALRLCIYAAMYKVAYGSSKDIAFVSAIWSISIAQIIFSLDRPDPTIQIGDEIKQGSISTHLLRPLNYVHYVLTGFFGRSIPSLVSSTLFILATASIITRTIPQLGVNFLLFMLCMFFGTIVVAFISIFFGLCGFWTEDTKGFSFISQKMALLFGGLIIPLSILPSAVRNIVNWTPWTVALGRPGYVLTHFTYSSLFELLAIQVFYIVLLYVACLILMKNGITKLNVSGG